jgi:hypothetical protein
MAAADLSDDILLFVEELATATPYRLFSSRGALMCRFCMRLESDQAHAPNCEFVRAQNLHLDARVEWHQDPDDDE